MGNDGEARQFLRVKLLEDHPIADDVFGAVAHPDQHAAKDVRSGTGMGQRGE